MRPALWPLAVAAGLLAASLSAQTLPVPAPPPEPSPEPSPAPPGAPVPSPSPEPLPRAEAPRREHAPAWAYEGSLGVGWDSNINFQAGSGPSDAMLVPGGMLARTFSSPRGRLRAEAAGHWIAYASEKEFDRGYADFSLDGRYAASARTSLSGSASYTLGHSDSSQPLLEQGVFLPLVETRTFMGALGVSRRLARRTSLRVDGRVYRTGFEAPGWSDGASLRGTATLEHDLGSRDTAAIVYSVENVWSDQADTSYLTHFGSLQYTRVLFPRTSLLLEGGASYTPDRARAGLESGQSFFGGASLAGRIGRSSLTAFVRREVVPAFGISLSRLELRVGLSAIIRMGERWELDANVVHVSPDDPEDTAVPYASTLDADAALARRLGQRLTLTGRTSFRRRGASSALASARAFEATLALSVTGPSADSRPPAGR